MAYLIRTRDDLGKLSFLLVLPFDHRFDDRRVVGAKVYEAMSDASLEDRMSEGWSIHPSEPTRNYTNLPYCLEESKRRGVPISSVSFLVNVFRALVSQY